MKQKSDIWGEMNRMQRQLDRTFNRFFNREISTSEPPLLPLLEDNHGNLMPANWAQPLADMYETEKDIVAQIDMPGIQKSDIKINATEKSVEVKAEKNFEKKKDRKGVYEYERSHHGFYRYMDLPETIKPENVNASLKDGVLEIHLPKTNTKKRKMKQITVK